MDRTEVILKASFGESRHEALGTCSMEKDGGQQRLLGIPSHTEDFRCRTVLRLEHSCESESVYLFRPETALLELAQSETD